MSARESVLELKSRIGGDIIGQEHVVERLLIGLLANGNLLVVAPLNPSRPAL